MTSARSTLQPHKPEFSHSSSPTLRPRHSVCKLRGSVKGMCSVAGRWLVQTCKPVAAQMWTRLHAEVLSGPNLRPDKEHMGHITTRKEEKREGGKERGEGPPLSRVL